MGEEDGGARGGLGGAQRRSETQMRGREELAKLSAAMATTFPPEQARGRGRRRMDGH